MPELQVPPAPHERAQQGPRPMEEGPFRALIAAVRNQSFSDSQLAVIQQAATRNYFRVGQIVDLIELVAFSASKLRVLELGAPRVVDPENAFAVYDAFAFSADKAQATADPPPQRLLTGDDSSRPRHRGAGVSTGSRSFG